jgi:imidazolonepropionase
MKVLIENAKQIVTCRTDGRKFNSGKYQSEIGLIGNSSIYIENGIIKWIGKNSEIRRRRSEFRKSSVKKIDASDKVIMPGFIDSHTHVVFAGDRANEYRMRLEGKTYEEIAQSGGGIVNTVSSVRKIPKAKLIELAEQRIWNSVSFGVTTLEAKSGYGLDTKNEIKMLEVISDLNKHMPIDILPTFLGAHAFPKEMSRRDYFDMILYEMIPIVAKRKLARFIDVFCEKNYFTPEETNEIFEQGIRFGLIPKLHTNQFYSVGGIETAVKNKAISVDHLEVMTDDETNALKGTGIVACVLPGVSYFLNIPYAPARKLIENDIPVAIATDFNPGSCMTENIQLIMSLAAQYLKMNAGEIINAVTVNAAASLGISDTAGSIEVGKQADLLIFDMPSYEHLIYHFGMNQLESVIKKGEMILINSSYDLKS